MSWKETAEPLLTRMPSVSRPERHVRFRRQLMWTTGTLIIYFFLTNVAIYGLGGHAQDIFGQFRSILAGGSGSVLQLGIGPIVTASIVLQLLGGADLLGLDTNEPRDQVLYQGLQKLLVVVMICLTGLPMVFAGGFLPPDPKIGAQLGIGTLGVQWLMFAQIFVGGILILFMDEVISKWGVGSGIGLFIVAGVSQRAVGGLLTWGPGPRQPGIIPTWIGMATGAIPIQPLFSGGFQDLFFGQGQLLAIVTTIVIFVVVVYAESVRVEIPLSHARVKGARGRFPVKLIYASVLPLIFVRALQANIQFFGRILAAEIRNLPAWVAVYSNGQPVSGLFYYLNPIHQPTDWMWWLGAAGAAPWQIALRVGMDMLFMIVGGAIFAIFWVETSDMGPDATARQIQQSGMQIPGFRRNPAIMEKVMERYIPPITVLGGVLIAILAILANMLGTIGGISGTSLLLAVSITYQLYEEIAEEQLMELHPIMRQMFG